MNILMQTLLGIPTEITLHYATKNLDLDVDIPVFKFKSLKDLHDFIENKVIKDDTTEGGYKKSNTVYIFTFDMFGKEPEESEIFITERIGLISDIFKQAYFFGLDLVRVFYLQEYSSYEEAYFVALSMREKSPMCYEPDND